MRLSSCRIKIPYLLETILPSINASCINSSIRSSMARQISRQRKSVTKEQAITESPCLTLCFTGPDNIHELRICIGLGTGPDD